MPLNLINLGVKSIQRISQISLRKSNKFQEGNPFKKFRFSKNPILCLGIFLFLCLIAFSLLRDASIKEDFSFSAPCSEINRNLFFEQADGVLFETLQTVVIGENSFKEAVPVTVFEGRVLGILTARTIEKMTERKEITEYIVKEGDSLSLIAQKFGISLETVLWANDLSKGSKISPGRKLTILPVSGIMHLVKKGETLSQLAEKYKADISKVIDFNELFEEGKIFVGDLLIIPGGEMPLKSPSKPAVQYVPLASSYFICPIPSPCSITQGLHWYNAIDFSNGRCGELVFAAAGGEIQRVGYHSVAGNYIRILHPNGIVTFYGHLSTILVEPGQKVSQGEMIGYIGNTGFTIGRTGCHLHFEVRGGRNPFAR